MNPDSLQLGSEQRQLKKEVAYIMSCFQDTIGSYANNRRQLDLVLNQLLKAHRSYRIHKHEAQILNNLSNKEDIYFEFYLVNNISCCYQTKKQLPKALEYLKKADKELSYLEELIQKSQLDYETRKIQLISVHMRMARAKLNLCGLYALSEIHMEALLQCSQAFGILEKVIDSVCDYTMGQKFYGNFLQLQKCIKDPSCEIKEVQIRNNYWNNVMNGQSDEEVRDIFISIFRNSNSKEQIQVRSCLGKIITKNIEKIQQISEESRTYLKKFNIGSIMRIIPLNIEDLSKNKEKSEYTNLRFLHELMVYVSVANYTVSTELRIMSMSESEAPTLESLSEEENNLHRKEKRMIEAERHHFFAIELIYRIASGYVKECPFFSRLIKVYEEVYLLKDNIEIIPEKVDEENETSMLPNDQKIENEYFGKKFKESILQTPKAFKKALSSHKELSKLKKKQRLTETESRNHKKSLKKTPSNSSKFDYLGMSPRSSNNSTNFTSGEKKLRFKNKSTEKLIPGSTTSSTASIPHKKKKQLAVPKSPRKIFGH